MKKNNVLKTIGIVLVSVLLTGLLVGFIANSNNKSSTVRTVRTGQDRSYTQLYTHHFDVVLSLDQLGLSSVDPNNTCCAVINFNVLSNNPTPYAKLSDMEGDGYIASAFGRFVPLDDNVNVTPPLVPLVLNARLVYEGTVWVDVVSIYGGNALVENGRSFFISNMADYVVRDSVSVI